MDDERANILVSGFVLGAIAGAAAMVLMGPENRREFGKQARRKFDELTRGRSIDEVSGSVRRGVRGVLAEVKKERLLQDQEGQELLTAGRRN